MEKEDVINYLVGLTLTEYDSVIDGVGEARAEIESKTIAAEQVEKQKEIEEVFQTAVPLTLAEFNIDHDSVEDLEYWHRGDSGSYWRESSAIESKLSASFIFKLEDGSKAELEVIIKTEDADDGEKYGYPASVNQELKIKGEVVYDDYDNEGEGDYDLSECYDLLLEAGIPQTEIDKVAEELPSTTYEYMID